VRIASARPGVIIGRRGADIDRLRTDLGKITKKEVNVDIKEIKNPAVDATLVAQGVAFQMEKRVGFRRAMKRSVEQTIQAGAKGIRSLCLVVWTGLRSPVVRSIMLARSRYRRLERILIRVC